MKNPTITTNTRFVTRNCCFNGRYTYGKVYEVLEWRTDPSFGTLFDVKDDKGRRCHYTPDFSLNGEYVWSSCDFEKNLQKILEE